MVYVYKLDEWEIAYFNGDGEMERTKTIRLNTR